MNFYISFLRNNSMIVSLFDLEKTSKDVTTQIMMIAINKNNVFQDRKSKRNAIYIKIRKYHIACRQTNDQ